MRDRQRVVSASMAADYSPVSSREVARAAAGGLNDHISLWISPPEAQASRLQSLLFRRTENPLFRVRRKGCEQTGSGVDFGRRPSDVNPSFGSTDQRSTVTVGNHEKRSE